MGKLSIISEFMTSQTGKQIITLHILSNISRSKRNQTVRFRQFLEYNMRNIFLKQSYGKWCGETIPTPFSKKSKLTIPLEQQFELLCSLFLL